MSVGLHDYETSSYSAAIAFDAQSGLIVPGQTNPIVIPLRLTSYIAPTKKVRTQPISVLPLLGTNTNGAYGGQIVYEGVQELPKITMEGTIDTPTTTSGTYLLPNVTVSGNRITYAELIAMYIEGRFNVSSDGSQWDPMHPVYFQDPYGRVYGDYTYTGAKQRPQIVDFSAGYLEGTPMRQKFTMVIGI